MPPLAYNIINGNNLILRTLKLKIAEFVLHMSSVVN